MEGNAGAAGLRENFGSLEPGGSSDNKVPRPLEAATLGRGSARRRAGRARLPADTPRHRARR